LLQEQVSLTTRDQVVVMTLIFQVDHLILMGRLGLLIHLAFLLFEDLRGTRQSTPIQRQLLQTMSLREYHDEKLIRST
jgi:hypothetical protein